MNPTQAKFAAARNTMSAALIERDDEIDLALTALVAGEHLLLVGPPGCGKSLVMDSILSLVDGNGFSILLTKHTNPEEVCGPVSLKALQNESYRRVTRNRLPEAHVAFLDEIWKASSAILNTLLKMLNEGLYENDGVQNKIPLRLCVAASNEWPSQENGKELSALLDRFLLRKTVRPIATKAGLERLLFDANVAPVFASKIGLAELDAARTEARALPWSDAARDGLFKILSELAKEGIQPGDRRKRKAVGIVAAYAYLDGATEIGTDHLDVLSYVLWDDPAEQPEKCARVVARVANPIGARVASLLLECETLMSGSDLSQPDDSTKAAAKLKEIGLKLAAMGDHPKALRARDHVRAELKRVKLTFAKAFDC